MAEYYFRLPTYAELSPAQINAITDENPIALSGGPGTGKSVVSLLRHITNHTKEHITSSQLLTFTTSLALYLKKCTEKQSLEASNHVDSAIHWKHNHTSQVDEIIMDEAQDLPLDFNKDLMRYCRIFSYGADNQQLITSYAKNPDGSYNLTKCSPEEALRGLFPQDNFHVLSQNYRNSRKILTFTKEFFVNASIPKELINRCKIEGEFPRVLIYGNDIKKQDNAIISIIKQYKDNADINTAILVPFSNSNRLAGETSTAKYYKELINRSIPGTECSIYTHEDTRCTEIKNIHITPFKSSKGLEFDNVIIPDFHLALQTFNVVSWRDFYVGITRARSNLYLFSRSEFNNIQYSGPNKIYEKVVL